MANPVSEPISATETLPATEGETGTGGRRYQRRTFRRIGGGVELRLGLLLFGITGVFALLFFVNSSAAFGRIYNALLLTAPDILEGEIGAQARAYLLASAAILAGYLVAVYALCVAFMNRLLGPTVALERHVRSLKLGDYSSRLNLRAGDQAYNELARHLNELAERLAERDHVRRNL